MGADWNSRIKTAAIAGLLIGGIGFALVQWRDQRNAGADDARVWFYDLSEQRLYAAAGDIIPPDKGIGGKAGDGVRAVVVAFRGGTASAKNRRIAYLETYTSELKVILEGVRMARAAAKPFGGVVPSRDSEFFQANTLVKSADGESWQAINSVEGQRITSAWRSWRGPSGQAPVVCTP